MLEPVSAAACAALFGWFTGTTAQSDFSSPCASVVGLFAFTDRPCAKCESVEDHRFSSMLFLSVRRS